MAFKLGDLSPDIILLVFERLPSYWHVVSLRLSCKAINAVYKQYRNQIDQAQADRLTRPVLEYYRFLTILHIDADKLELPHRSWDIEGDKTSFANRVICSLPFFRMQGGMGLHISSNFESMDYRRWRARYDIFRGHPESRIVDSPNQHHWVSLAYTGVLFIDSMNASIHDFIPRHERASPSDDVSQWRATEHITAYFEAQRRSLLDMVYIPPFGPSAATIYLQDHRMSFLRQEDQDTLVAIFVKHGWPHHFNKHEAYLELDAAFDTIRYKANWT